MTSTYDGFTASHFATWYARAISNDSNGWVCVRVLHAINSTLILWLRLHMASLMFIWGRWLSNFEKKNVSLCAVFFYTFFYSLYDPLVFFIYFFLCDFYTFFLVLFFYSLYNTFLKNLSLLLIFIVIFSFLPLSFHFHFHIDCPFQFFVFQFRLLKGSEGGTKWDLRKKLFNKDKYIRVKKQWYSWG